MIGNINLIQEIGILLVQHTEIIKWNKLTKSYFGQQ